MANDVDVSVYRGPQPARAGAREIASTLFKGGWKASAALILIVAATIATGYIASRTTFFRVALEFLRTHWTALLPVVLTAVVSMGVRAGYGALQRMYGRRLTVELPLHAGAWARQKASELRLARVGVVAVEEELGTSNAFHPRARLVTLRSSTFFGRNPFAWAVAAHEIGHAWLHARWPLWIGSTWRARMLASPLMLIGIYLIAANLLFGQTAISQLALAAIVTSLACNVLVLVEEAATSLQARRWLRGDPAVPAEHHGIVSLALGAAFGTYVASVLLLALLFVQFGTIARLVEQHAVFEPAAWPSRGPLWISLVLSIIVALWVLAGLRGHKAAPVPSRPKKDGASLIALPLGVLLLLVWDQALGTPFQVAVVLAAVVARDFLKVLVMPFEVAGLAVIAGLWGLWRGLGAILRRARADKTTPPPVEVDPAEIQNSNKLLASAVRAAAASPIQALRWYAERLAVIPFLWLLWSSWT